MTSQRVVWTLLPNGIDPDTGRAKASVLVSPRLNLPNTAPPFELGQFADWEDWTDTLLSGSFSVETTGGDQFGAEIVSAPNIDVWRAIFPATTFVRPYVFDQRGLRNKTILSYPVVDLAERLEILYGDAGLAAAAGELPTRDAIRRQLRGVDPTTGEAGNGLRPKPKDAQSVINILRGEKERRERQDRRETEGGLGQPVPYSGKFGAASGLMADPGSQFDLLNAYHTPLATPQTKTYAPDQKPDGYDAAFPGSDSPYRDMAWEGRQRSALPALSDWENLIDFHEIASSLAQYPAVSRLCGLVFDIVFDRPSDGPVVGLRLVPNWATTAFEPDVTPVIATRNDGDAFFPATRFSNGPIVRRHLRLAREDFALVQVDVDGAGLKLNNFDESLRQDLPPRYSEDSFDPKAQPPERAGLPSLRTGGLMLAERRRDLALEDLFARADEMQSALLGSGDTTPVLFAEDVVRGYRVDVRDDVDNRWRSLFFRQTRYALKNTGQPLASEFLPEVEEGMARLAASESPDANNADVIKIHEALATWTGWSLAAPEPGEHIARDDSGDPMASDPEETPPGLPLETAHRVAPGTLPRMRFGRAYQMRVRLVDLAGESQAFTEDDAQPQSAVSASVTLRRYEPIEPPVTALVSVNGTPDPVDDGASLQRMVIRTFNDTPDKNTVTIPTIDRRHQAAPRVGHRFAEMHGALDTGPGGSINRDLWPLLTQRDSPLPEHTIARTKGAGSVEPERYIVADEAFTLPYLPDPLAMGVAIRIEGLPGVNPTQWERVMFYTGATATQWPDAQPFQIVVGEKIAPSPQLIEDETNGRRFVIPLPKAERIKIHVSCMMPFGRVEDMAVWAMMLARAGDMAQELEDLKRRVAAGQHWMFTPTRTLEAVHATQKPLVLPVMSNMGVGRELRETEAQIGVEALPLNSKSTVRLDMLGEWTEPLDDPGDADSAAAPAVRPFDAHAFQRRVARLETTNDELPFLSGVHNFSDTKYRRVTYRIDATTRFREYFPPAIRDVEDEIKITSPTRVDWIPNSAPPAPPKVLYVVPTFGWVRPSGGRPTDLAVGPGQQTTSRRTSLRVGGGLRVYMERPWFMTGFTEMLGVVLAHAPNGDPISNASIDANYTDSVTQWGADPVWPSTGRIQRACPPISSFPLARTSAPITFDGTSLPAIEGTDLAPGPFQHTRLPHPDGIDGLSSSQIFQNNTRPLDVAPHQVGYDEDRGLWYCDIVIRPPRDVYSPFVRLALARYNPVSVFGAHLSSIVATEFQQLFADRLVIVTHNRQSNTARVAVHGLAQPPRGSGRTREPFRVQTQVLRPGADPETGWVDEVGEEASVVIRDRTLGLQVQRDAQTVRRLQGDAQRLVDQGRFDELVRNDDLVVALQPPLIWETQVKLPDAPDGGRRRLLVTEREFHRRESDDLGMTGATTAAPWGSRVIYMETMEI